METEILPPTQELCCETTVLSCVPKPTREAPMLLRVCWHCDQIPRRWAAQGKGPDNGKARRRVAKGRGKWTPQLGTPEGRVAEHSSKAQQDH